MSKEENNNHETPTNHVETTHNASGVMANYSWHKNAIIGLAGGVIGALIVVAASGGFQGAGQDDLALRITSLAERTDELKTDREREFSRVFSAIAELNDAHKKHETVINALNENISQSASAQNNQTNQLQNLIDTTTDSKGKIDDLQNRLALLEVQSAKNVPSEDHLIRGAELTTLKIQLETLEKEVTALPQIIQQLEQLQADYEKSGKRIFDAFVDLDQEIRELQSTVASLSSMPPPANDQGMAMLIAANSLKAAVERGGSYTNELQIFSSIAPVNTPLDALEKYAASGLPNIAELVQQFTKLADEIAATENTLPEEAGLADQLLHQGSRLYSSRPVGNIEGNNAGAIAARMEVAIGNGDFARALNEAQSLPADAKALAADFLELLQAREAADTLLSHLIATTLQEKGNLE